MNEEPEISYSVKELIRGLSDRIDAFMTLMASKADQSTVAQAHLRIDGIDVRLLTVEHSLESKARHNTDRREFRRWIVPTLISAVTIIILLIQVFRP